MVASHGAEELRTNRSMTLVLINIRLCSPSYINTGRGVDEIVCLTDISVFWIQSYYTSRFLSPARGTVQITVRGVISTQISTWSFDATHSYLFEVL